MAKAVEVKRRVVRARDSAVIFTLFCRKILV